jgi:hypothetical protein
MSNLCMNKSCIAVLATTLLSGCSDRASDVGDTDVHDDTTATGGGETFSTQPATTDTGQTTTTASSATGGDATSAADTTDSGDATGPGDSETTSTDTTGAPVGSYPVSGTVTRSTELAEGNDGIGTLWLAVVDNCGFDFEVAAAAMIPDADLSRPGAAAPFTVPDVPEGAWFVIAYLDDNENAQLPDPQPDPGDLVGSDGLGGVACMPVIVDGAAVEGITLDLNFVLPG